MKQAVLAFTLLTAAAAAQADTLVTRSYTITITGLEEYVVSCDRVKYTGVSKRTGQSITLMGSTVHTLGPDGVTPAHFLGYRFRNGRTTYFVGEDGELRLTRGARVLVQEMGVWKR